MANKEDVKFVLGLDLAGFHQGLAQAKAAMKATSAAIYTVGAKLATVFTGVFAVKKVIDWTVNVFEVGTELDRLSRETGIAANEIKLMERALDRSEVSTSEAASMLEDLRKKMFLAQNGASEYGLILRTLKLDYDKLAAKSLPEQFEEIAMALQRIENVTLRASLAQELLGENGRKAAMNMRPGDLTNAAGIFGKTSDTLGKSAASIAMAQASLKRITTSIQDAFNAVIARAAPVIEKIAAKIEALLPLIMDAAEKFGTKLLQGATILWRAFKAGDLTDVLMKGLKLAGLYLQNTFFKVLKGFSMAFPEAMKQAFTILTRPEFWMQMKNMEASTLTAGLAMVASAALEFIKQANAMWYAGIITAMTEAAIFFQTILEKVMETAFKPFNAVIEKLSAVIPALKGVKLEAPKLSGFMREQAIPFDKLQKTLEKWGDKLIKPTQAVLDKVADKAFDEMGKAHSEVMDIIGKNTDLSVVANKFAEGFRKKTPMDERMAKAQAELRGMTAKYLKGGLLEGESAKKGVPGQVPGAAIPKMLEFTTRFDEFRRIGGGMGNMAQSIAQRSLNVLTEIRDLLRKPPESRRSTGGVKHYSFVAATPGP